MLLAILAESSNWSNILEGQFCDCIVGGISQGMLLMFSLMVVATVPETRKTEEVSAVPHCCSQTMCRNEL